jgi:hypothetical protein
MMILTTITISARLLLRTGSVIAGLVSIAWGLNVVLAYQSVVTTGSFSMGNAYSNGTFVLIQMFEAVIVGMFALVLSVLSR